MSESLFGGTFARGPVAALGSAHAWLSTLLEVEAGLGRAAGSAGAIPATSVEAIVSACRDPAAYDIARLARDAADSGNPVVPLVLRIRERVPEDAQPHVHFGATSQDILDTAAMLVAKRSVAALVGDLRAAADAAAGLAAEHRDSPIVGRTLLQAAVPTTFGLKAAGWMTALDAAVVRLERVVASLPVQYGGPVGTLASAGAWGPAIRASLAEHLGLVVTPLAWHTDRTPVLDLASGLGIAGGAVATTAVDVVLLAQSEVGEVSEGVSGRGGSSSMPHKHNPIAAISARACVLRVPGLVSTLLSVAGQEHERAAGGWAAEWETLADLLRLAGAGAAWLADSLEHLQVHADVMRARAVDSLADNGSGDLSGHMKAAAERVDDALAQRPGAA
jgi:3-carboxy-cis,cis-muconate cycloisomerase